MAMLYRRLSDEDVERERLDFTYLFRQYTSAKAKLDLLQINPDSDPLAVQAQQQTVLKLSRQVNARYLQLKQQERVVEFQRQWRLEHGRR